MTILNEIQVLKETPDYVFINKPSGLMVHPDGRSEEPFLTDWVSENYPETEGVGEPINLQDGEVIEKPGIVHRLDTETSGVMVIAKNEKSFLHLKNQFKEREVSKTYNALVYGHLKEEKGIIDRAIGRSSQDFRLRSAQRGAKGKLREAVTDYVVLEERDIKGERVSFVEARPKTGRTHQIRVHFKAIHHPVVCDPLYAPNHDCLGFSRLMLHAREISFKDLNGEVVRVESPLPEEFSST